MVNLNGEAAAIFWPILDLKTVLDCNLAAESRLLLYLSERKVSKSCKIEPKLANLSFLIRPTTGTDQEEIKDGDSGHGLAL